MNLSNFIPNFSDKVMKKMLSTGNYTKYILQSILLYLYRKHELKEPISDRMLFNNKHKNIGKN